MIGKVIEAFHSNELKHLTPYKKTTTNKHHKLQFRAKETTEHSHRELQDVTRLQLNLWAKEEPPDEDQPASINKRKEIKKWKEENEKKLNRKDNILLGNGIQIIYPAHEDEVPASLILKISKEAIKKLGIEEKRMFDEILHRFK